MPIARLLVCFVTVAMLAGCATIAGGLIGAGVGIATGHPVSGALIRNRGRHHDRHRAVGGARARGQRVEQQPIAIFAPIAAAKRQLD